MLTVKSDPVHLACVFGDYAEGILLLLFLFWVVEYFMHKGNHRIPKKEQAVGLFSFLPARGYQWGEGNSQ